MNSEWENAEYVKPYTKYSELKEWLNNIDATVDNFIKEIRNEISILAECIEILEEKESEV